MNQEGEEIIAVARALTPNDRQLLMEVLATSSGGVDALAASGKAFWANRSLGEIAADQAASPAGDIATLLADFWPEDESADECTCYVYDERRRARANGQ